MTATVPTTDSALRDCFRAIDAQLAVEEQQLDPQALRRGQAKTVGLARNLELSRRCLAAQGPAVFDGTGRSLIGSRLGHLLRDHGWIVYGATGNFEGTLIPEWPGSLAEIEARIAAADRAAADRRVAEAPPPTAEEAAEQHRLNEALNRLCVRVGPDARDPCLQVYDADGEPIDPATLPAIERQAFEQAAGRFLAEQAARRPVGS